MTIAFIMYGILALIVVATAAGMLISRSALYSALLLVLNFGAVALLYFTLGAPFIALTQISVYAGAIMVLFLFVIMLLGTERHDWLEPLRMQRPLAVLLAVVIVAQAAFLIISMWPLLDVMVTPGPEFGSPQVIGQLLFDQYALPFLLIGFLLLAATVGVITITRPEPLVQRQLLAREPVGTKEDSDAS